MSVFAVESFLKQWSGPVQFLYEPENCQIRSLVDNITGKLEIECVTYRPKVIQ